MVMHILVPQGQAISWLVSSNYQVTGQFKLPGDWSV